MWYNIQNNSLKSGILPSKIERQTTIKLNLKKKKIVFFVLQDKLTPLLVPILMNTFKCIF